MINEENRSSVSLYSGQRTYIGLYPNIFHGGRSRFLNIYAGVHLRARRTARRSA